MQKRNIHCILMFKKMPWYFSYTQKRDANTNVGGIFVEHANHPSPYFTQIVLLQY